MVSQRLGRIRVRVDSPAKDLLPEDTSPAHTKTRCANTAWSRQLTWHCRMGLSSISISILGWKSSWTCTSHSETGSTPFCGCRVKWDAKSRMLVSAVSSLKLGRKGQRPLSLEVQMSPAHPGLCMGP